MRRTETLCFLLPLLALSSACSKTASEPHWAYRGDFHRAIAAADRIVVRDGGFNGPRPAGKQKVLFQLVQPAEVRLVFDKLQFENDQATRSCPCFGYPGVDWYRKNERLAVTSIQHGLAVRWKEFPGDAALTKESSEWLQQWLTAHGIPQEKLK
jgi:hypothetical protein